MYTLKFLFCKYNLCWQDHWGEWIHLEWSISSKHVLLLLFIVVCSKTLEFVTREHFSLILSSQHWLCLCLGSVAQSETDGHKSCLYSKNGWNLYQVFDSLSISFFFTVEHANGMDTLINLEFVNQILYCCCSHSSRIINTLSLKINTCWEYLPPMT